MVSKEVGGMVVRVKRVMVEDPRTEGRLIEYLELERELKMRELGFWCGVGVALVLMGCIVGGVSWLLLKITLGVGLMG
jgi:hypothetical protein